MKSKKDPQKCKAQFLRTVKKLGRWRGKKTNGEDVVVNKGKKKKNYES